MKKIPYEKTKGALFALSRALFTASLSLVLLFGNSQVITASNPQDQKIALNLKIP